MFCVCVCVCVCVVLCSEETSMPELKNRLRFSNYSEYPPSLRDDVDVGTLETMHTYLPYIKCLKYVF